MNLLDYDEVEKQFDPQSAFQCKHCGELVACDGEIMEEHLDDCETFQRGLEK